MKTLKITIKAKIATAQENLLKEEMQKLFEKIFLKEYTYASERVTLECPKCAILKRNDMGTCDEHSTF